METKFFFCKHCGNVVVKVVDSGVTPLCCGEEMIELVPNTVDAMVEKHLPAIEHLDGGSLRVKVGTEPHPMTPEHHIDFLFVETENGNIIRYLNPTGKPLADICICNEKPVAVYAFCNLHGLWKLDLRGKMDAQKCSRCRC